MKVATMYVLGYPLIAVLNILNALLWLYSIVIIASVVASWLRVTPFHPAMRILNMLTEPVYLRLRRYMPNTGQIDLAPLAAILLIMLIQQGILPIFYRIGASLIGA